jgi:peroxiredoxin
MSRTEADAEIVVAESALASDAPKTQGFLMSTRSILRRRPALVAVFALAHALFVTNFGLAAEPDRHAELPLSRSVGQRMSDFKLNDVVTGRAVSLYGFMGKKAVVVVFLGNDCPVGSLYLPRLIELNKEYRPKGVVVLGVNSNAHETAADVARLVKETGIDFPVLKDVGNKVSDAALAERTCETLVLDGFGRVRYRGAIDDQYIQGKSKAAPSHSYVRDALDALIADKPVAVISSKVAGCLIDRVDPQPIETARGPRIRPAPPEVIAAFASKPKDPKLETAKVTYSADIATIIQNKCQGCHRPGQVGPFSLDSYDDVRKHAAMIREVVDDRRMPPWHADPRFGHFTNDRSLSAKEHSALLAWIDQGAQLGDPTALPKPREFADTWSIGKPDLVIEMPETYVVPAQGVVEYTYFRVPTNFKEDRWVQAAEAIPGDRSVVHHIIVYVADPAKRRPGGRPRPDHFCGYAPGDVPTVLPEGTAKRIPAGAEVLFQVHYTPNGRVRSDRSKLGLIFAKAKVTREAFTIGIANPDLLIPPRESHVAVDSSLVVPSEVRLLSLLPHMHLRGKDFQYSVTRPGESPRILLSVPAYDFGWQTVYSLAEPLTLPKGTRIDCVAHYDNSESNPFNPDPKQLVRWGEQTFEEMMIGYIDVDTPIGSPRINGTDFTPRSQRATITAIQALRRAMTTGKPDSTASTKSTATASAKPSTKP